MKYVDIIYLNLIKASIGVFSSYFSQVFPYFSQVFKYFGSSVLGISMSSDQPTPGWVGVLVEGGGGHLYFGNDQEQKLCHYCHYFSVFFALMHFLQCCSSLLRRWSGVAKVSCILRHWGIQLILAYNWARLPILVADKGRGGMFLFWCFFIFIPVPLFYLSFSFISFFPCPSLSSPLLSLFSLSVADDSSTISFLPFSGSWHKVTHKGWHVVKPQHNQSKKPQISCFLGYLHKIPEKQCKLNLWGNSAPARIWGQVGHFLCSHTRMRAPCAM